MSQGRRVSACRSEMFSNSLRRLSPEHSKPGFFSFLLAGGLPEATHGEAGAGGHGALEDSGSAGTGQCSEMGHTDLKWDNQLAGLCPCSGCTQQFTFVTISESNLGCEKLGQCTGLSDDRPRFSLRESTPVGTQQEMGPGRA